jgi:hypothetical protein
MYLFASIESHYITLDKSQQCTYRANNTNKMHRSNTNVPKKKGHHIIIIIIIITAIGLSPGGSGYLTCTQI